MTHPVVVEGDFINVGRFTCIVDKVFDCSEISICSVVYRDSIPIKTDVNWNGSEWVFQGYGRRLHESDRHYRTLLGKLNLA